MTATRYALTIEYKGTEYYGWQKQPELPTIQGAIEDAIFAFSGQRPELTASGRTDAGVHARGQVAHVDFAPFTKQMEPFEIVKAINAHLRPAPIAVLDAQIVAPDFNARFAAKNKLYVYRIINRQAFLTLDKGLAWHILRPLDAMAMHEAAQILLGQHDFSTFRDSECQAKNPIRTLDRIAVQGFETTKGTQEILIEVEAMSFLHHMVRNIAGSLVMVGEGKWSADDLRAALEAKDRKAGGPTAPAEGLYMVRVDYPD
ncbi:MAG: tRNA pseudouridine(38-40) synthase TruA [Alphaproteobacteria bacterium]